jgi:uncharacterized protein (DUF1330 family)
MSAYLIGAFTVNDAARLGEYAKQAGASYAPFDVTFLSQDQSPVTIEGEFPGQVLTLMRFANEEDATAWYNSDAYSSIRHLRAEAADTHFLVLARGLD